MKNITVFLLILMLFVLIFGTTSCSNSGFDDVKRTMTDEDEAATQTVTDNWSDITTTSALEIIYTLPYWHDSTSTNNNYKNTAMHEMGHIFGWSGHSSNSTHVMYGTVSAVTSLAEADKNHVKQVYNLF
jgi:predicted Zn-dependent protease